MPWDVASTEVLGITGMFYVAIWDSLPSTTPSADCTLVRPEEFIRVERGVG
jgi:hypothetical protein